MKITNLKKDKQKHWDKIVNSHKEGRFVHLSAYKDIIEKTYGYKGYFLYIEEDKEILAIFPFFKVRNIFFKKRFISQPFSEYGGILFKPGLNEKQKVKIISLLKAQLKNICVEIHGQQDELDFVGHCLTKKSFHQIAILKLDFYDNIYKKFDYQIKKAINKAQKGGVKVYEETCIKSIRNKFYPLYFKHLKKRHGIAPYPLKFFLNCYQYAPENIRIYFAQFDNKVIAALWGFLADDRVQISYNPSSKKYFHLRANDLLHAEFIKWACQNKFKYFDFGPASYPGQKFYKKKWGVKFLDYFHFYLSDKSIKSQSFVRQRSELIKKVIKFFWKHFMPDFLAKPISGFIRKKLGR